MEERQEVLPEAPLVVGLRGRPELGLPRKPPPRRELMEGLIFASGPGTRRSPDADLDLREDLVELALGLALCPPIRVGPERDDLAPAVGPHAKAVGGQPILALMRPDLSTWPLLHPSSSLRPAAAIGRALPQASERWNAPSGNVNSTLCRPTPRTMQKSSIWSFRLRSCCAVLGRSRRTRRW